MRRKDLRDEFSSLLRNRNQVKTLVGSLTRARDQAAFLQVADHHGEIAAGLEELAGEFAEAKRTDVVERFQHCELAGRKTGGFQLRHEERIHGIGGAQELDVGVERTFLPGGAVEVFHHGFSFSFSGDGSILNHLASDEEMNGSRARGTTHAGSG